MKITFSVEADINSDVVDIFHIAFESEITFTFVDNILLENLRQADDSTGVFDNVNIDMESIEMQGSKSGESGLLSGAGVKFGGGGKILGLVVIIMGCWTTFFTL